MATLDIYKKDDHWIAVVEIRIENQNAFEQLLLPSLLQDFDIMFERYGVSPRTVLQYHYGNGHSKAPTLITFELPSTLTRETLRKMKWEFDEGLLERV